MKTRPQGMGFWRMPIAGQSTFSDKIVKQIMDAQKAGKEIAIPSRLKKNIEEFKQYPEDNFAGHGAWLEWPWKLHRINTKKGSTFELYNLESDPMEANNQAEAQPERLAALKKKLDAWQKSVTQSLNGKDY